MEKISIIIPVYNVETYIRKCLDSVINQTYKNLEIICVNDGSTDNSGVICDEYAEKDTRFKVIHKSNGGNATAVNCGLNNFTGKYVGFVDPDDWVEVDYYENAYKIIKKNNVDIVCVGFYRNTIEECIEMKNVIPISKEKLNCTDILKYTFIRDKYPAFAAYRWNKLFNARLFRFLSENGQEIRVDESIKVGSDVLFFTECTLRADGAIYYNKPYYHYFNRENSLFNSKDIEKRKGSLKAYSTIIDILQRNMIDKDIIKWVKRFYVYHASLLAELALENNDIDNLRLMQNEINRFIIEYVETNSKYSDRIERIKYLTTINKCEENKL